MSSGLFNFPVATQESFGRSFLFRRVGWFTLSVATAGLLTSTGHFPVRTCPLAKPSSDHIPQGGFVFVGSLSVAQCQSTIACGSRFPHFALGIRCSFRGSLSYSLLPATSTKAQAKRV